jgi:predicted DNA-binding ribbon-helix-helix protein
VGRTRIAILISSIIRVVYVMVTYSAGWSSYGKGRSGEAMDDQQRRAKRHLPSAVIKRTVKISGAYTSVSLEDGFWNALREIAAGQGVTPNELVAKIDGGRDLDGEAMNLSSSIRLFVLNHYRARATTKR